MIPLTPDQVATLRDGFVPDQPGPLVALHVIQTGNGVCFVDRWPDPRAILAATAGNYALAGDPKILAPADLQAHIKGFVDASPEFLPLLRQAFPAFVVWDRIVLVLQQEPPHLSPSNAVVRRIEPADAYHVWGLSPASDWIAKTWGGPAGLAASRLAWGAFVRGRLVSITCPFFLGEHYEDIGVVTEPAFRGRGLGVACAGALCRDILHRGRRPSWTTDPENRASLRVAEKLGFEVWRHDELYVIGIPVPEPP